MDGNEVWNSTNKPMPNENGIKVDGKILQAYVGEYEIPSVFSFSVTIEQDKLFLQATEQEKLEMFAETESKFFLKVNDAQLEFVKDDWGKSNESNFESRGKTSGCEEDNVAS